MGKVGEGTRVWEGLGDCHACLADEIRGAPP